MLLILNSNSSIYRGTNENCTLILNFIHRRHPGIHSSFASADVYSTRWIRCIKRKSIMAFRLHSSLFAPPAPSFNIPLSYFVSNTRHSPADVTESVSLHALRTGYRHIDSARAYRNEQPCADAIRASGLPRSEIFFTSKVPPQSMGYEETKVREEDPLLAIHPFFLSPSLPPMFPRRVCFAASPRLALAHLVRPSAV